ncbi:hypothetical protein evm_010723 [Chilo suppressalis]|nr:hypothetical protein evm_010723 [Chilo suppressalis]
MAPDCEETERLNVDGYHQEHQGRRILPEEPVPVHAWTEDELDRPDSATNSPGENRRLLSPPSVPHKSKLQAGLTLAVCNVPKKYPHTLKCARQKTKFEKRKEKLIEVLKPPYFIVSMIILIICIHLWLPKEARAWLEWSPTTWRHQPWRLLTYGCVHANAAHLALNAVVALAVRENDSKTLVKASRVMSMAVLVTGMVAAALHFSLWHDLKHY